MPAKNIDSKSRYVRLLLYVDNEKHMELLDRIRCDRGLFGSTSWQYIGICHVLLDDDGQEILEGEGKKHYHVYLAFQNPVWIKALCRRFGFFTDLGEPDDQFVRCITGRFDKALVYLTHLNTPDKEQYDASSLFGSPDLIAQYYKAALSYRTKKTDKRDSYEDVLAWISRQDGVITAPQMLRYLLDSPAFAIRHEYWLREIWQAHNVKIYRAENRAYMQQISATYEMSDDELREMGFNV